MSGLSIEDECVVLIWANSSEKSVSTGRPFTTMTRQGSKKPVCWDYSYLVKEYGSLLETCVVVSTPDSLRREISPERLPLHTAENPLIVPDWIARQVLGWVYFDYWNED